MTSNAPIIDPIRFDATVKYIELTQLTSGKQLAIELGITASQLSLCRKGKSEKKMLEIYPVILEKYQTILKQFDVEKFIIEEAKKREDPREFLEKLDKKIDLVLKYVRKLQPEDEYVEINGVKYQKMIEE